MCFGHHFPSTNSSKARHDEMQETQEISEVPGQVSSVWMMNVSLTKSGADDKDS